MLVLTPLLHESNLRATEQGTMAYITAPPLGWPVCAPNSGTDDALLLATSLLQVEAYAEAIAEAKLSHVADLCLVDFPESTPDEVHRGSLLPCIRPMSTDYRADASRFLDNVGHDGRPP